MRISTIILLFLPLVFISPAHAGKNHRVEIFAHHGILEDVPENTFAALKRIVELGIDGVEVDVRQTKDNQLILMADETIDRTTDGYGYVDRLLYAEIQQYDAGSWRGARFKNERVPLFSDVLKFCKVNQLKLLVNIRQTHVEKQALDLIKSCGMSTQVYLWGTLRNFNTEDAAIQGKDIVFLSPEELTEEGVNRVHDEKKYAFSILLDSDDRKTMKGRIEAGIDVMLVDYPCVMMDILGMDTQANDYKPAPNKNPKNAVVQEENDNKAFFINKIDTLVETIKGDDGDKSRTAALSMTILPQKYAIPPLIKLTRHRLPHIKQNAAWALSFFHEDDDEIISNRLQTLLKDKNADVRRAAVFALKRLGSRQAVSTLMDMIKTETNLGVKYEIARALGGLRDRGAAFTLSEVLNKEKSWYVKSACVEALGQLGGNIAMNALSNVLVTDTGEVASCARDKAAWALAAMGEKAVPRLAGALRDNEEVTRRRAGWAMIKIGSPAVPALVSMLRDIHKETRIRAAQALGWIRDTTAVDALLWTLKDKEPSIAAAAAWALGRIGNPDVISTLEDFAHSKNKEMRENVVEAIGRIKANTQGGKEQ
jgi:HEAT repeat protein/glycerophosphoryl diester phosphodiesterase